MKRLIESAFGRNRLVLILFVLILITGTFAYFRIAKESAPDVPIPIIYVSVVYEGISPEDAERLLVRPLERELQSIEGVDEMRAVAAQGFASATLEFTAGFDPDQAELDVRQAVETAQAELPLAAEEPVVQEVNVALFPVLTVILSGPVAECALIDLAEDFKDRIETLPTVLEVDIGGAREQAVEILVDPSTLESYGVPFEELLARVQRNNQLVAAGSIDTGAGKLALKVPGVIEDIEDVRAIPVKVSGDTVVRLGDVAAVRRGFKDPPGFARIDGQPAVALEVKKRIGANIIETIEAVKALLEQSGPLIPDSVSVTFLQDQSQEVRETLGDLQNNVIAAILLVMIVTVAMLGWRNALLVGLSIPASFFAGIVVIWWMGYTLNIIVLFSLILVLGMLVDSAVVTTELADRWMAGGKPPAEAYKEAAKRMSGPILASTAITLCVFIPLLFWEGVVGEFMKFLPITVIVIMTAALSIRHIYSRTIDQGAQGAEGLQAEQISADTIGILQLDLLEWDQRPRAARIIEEVRRRTAGIAGVSITVTEQEQGPTQSKPIQLRLFGPDTATLEKAAGQAHSLMSRIGGFTDVEDTTDVPGVEWRRIASLDLIARVRS